MSFRESGFAASPRGLAASRPRTPRVLMHLAPSRPRAPRVLTSRPPGLTSRPRGLASSPRAPGPRAPRVLTSRPRAPRSLAPSPRGLAHLAASRPHLTASRPHLAASRTAASSPHLTASHPHVAASRSRCHCQVRSVIFGIGRALRKWVLLSERLGRGGFMSFRVLWCPRDANSGLIPKPETLNPETPKP